MIQPKMGSSFSIAKLDPFKTSPAQQEVDLIHSRLKLAENMYKEWLLEQEKL